MSRLIRSALFASTTIFVLVLQGLNDKIIINNRDIAVEIWE